MNQTTPPAEPLYSGRAAEAELYVLLRKAGEDRHDAQALIDRHRDEVLRRAAAVPAAETTNQATLRDRIAQALADAEGWVWAPGFDKTRSPSFQGYLRAADAVLAVLLGPIPPDADVPAWTAIRAIQLMNETGRQRDRYRTAWRSARQRASAYGEGILQHVADRDFWKRQHSAEHARHVEVVRTLVTDRAAVLAEVLPDWEAVYEPGNVSDYLIGYANDQDTATGAAEAWLRSQAEVTGRLEWVADEQLATGRYDRWFELIERHDGGIDTGPGIIVRRRVAAEEQPETQTETPTEEQIVRDHVTTVHLIGEQLADVEAWLWKRLAEVRAAAVSQPDGEA